MHYSLVKTQKEKKITKIRTFSNNKYNIPLNLQIVYVRTGFDLDPTQEWIQAHVAQTMNL